MTGDTLRDLLEPLIGEHGSLSMALGEGGHVSFAGRQARKLTGVQIRPDGLVHVEHETGWVVVDPAEVAAVVWNSDPDSTPGQFL